MSQVALPEMKRLQYSDRLATASLAVGGTLGILIPPSVILIIYALLAEQSIVKLFAAASLWVGLDLLVPQLLLVFLAGGVLSVMLLLLRTAWGQGLFLSLFGRWMALPRLLGKGEPVPYGVAICLGSLALAPAMAMFSGVI